MQDSTNEGTVSPARQILLRHAIEHQAGRWAHTPGVGPSGATRYIWEVAGRRSTAEYEWIATYLAEHPEVFDLPFPVETWRERQLRLSDEADQRAMRAYRAGDQAAALAALDEAEALHPSPGDFFAAAREAVVQGLIDPPL